MQVYLRFNKRKIYFASLLAASMGVGALTSWIFTKRHYSRIAEEEIQSVTDFYKKKEKQAEKDLKKKYVKLEDFSKEYREALSNLEYEPPEESIETEFVEDSESVPLPPPVRDVHGNILEVSPAEANFILEGEHAQLKAKHNGKPYLISFEEYFEENPGYDKIDLSYYAEDDSVADDREDLVDDIGSKVSYKALKFFGWRSYDKNVVYVRNDRMGADYCITWNPGSYSKEVLQLMAEEDYPEPAVHKIRKMRAEE